MCEYCSYRQIPAVDDLTRYDAHPERRGLGAITSSDPVTGLAQMSTALASRWWSVGG